MVSPLIVVIAITYFAYWILEFLLARPKNFPPGPIRIPIFGSYLYLLLRDVKHFYVETQRWCDKYNSKVVALFIGSYNAVSVNDLEGIRRVFLCNDFDGRPFPYSVQLRSWAKRLGVFFTEGPFWLEQRRFTLRYMRDFGFGRRMERLEYIIEDETKLMIKLIEEGTKNPYNAGLVKDGRLIYLPEFFAAPFINSYLAVLTGHPLPEESRPILRKTTQSSILFQLAADATGGIISILPSLRYIFPKLSGYHGITKGHEALMDLMRDIIKQRKNRGFTETEGFIDFYLNEMKARKEAGGYTTFSDDQLLLIVADLLMPASSAVQSQLGMLVERLIHNPEIQDKIYNEIKTVVGSGRLPTLDDRPNLPYCEATLRESLRIDTLATLGVPHSTLVDTTLHGYSIPKDTIVITNLWQMHHDEKVWGDPETFRPERFVTEDGKGLAKDQSLPFGLGRRVCAGETFARNTMFLIYTGLLQNYKLTVPEGHPLPDLNDRLNGLVISPKDFWVKCIPRK
uniref:Cytochrome P450 CYP304W1 n=1 Tax=Chrysoperla zastrowi sillemi TaxID=482137 RepID=A0A9E7YFJ0_9NEOP|nr:cytochrome P450 CYP304W1 [Chrysoperla zastrowi sillemi]